MTATQATTNPKFVVAHTTAGHHEVRAYGEPRSFDGIDYTSFETAKVVRDRLNGVAPVVVETPTPNRPQPQDHLRKSAHRPARKPSRHNTVARLYANLTAYADRFNTGTITAGQYLTDVLGIDAEAASHLWSPLGKAIKKAYIGLHGDKPAFIRLAAVGAHLHRKIGYLLGEPALAAGANAYPGTAALIGG